MPVHACVSGPGYINMSEGKIRAKIMKVVWGLAGIKTGRNRGGRKIRESIGKRLD